MDDFEVGQNVTFVFETKTRAGGRINNYATGTIEKVGQRLSVRITDPLGEKDRYWREQWVGKIKVIHPDRVIPDLPAGDEMGAGARA